MSIGNTIVSKHVRLTEFNSQDLITSTLPSTSIIIPPRTEYFQSPIPRNKPLPPQKLKKKQPKLHLQIPSPITIPLTSKPPPPPPPPLQPHHLPHSHTTSPTHPSISLLTSPSAPPLTTNSCTPSPVNCPQTLHASNNCLNSLTRNPGTSTHVAHFTIGGTLIRGGGGARGVEGRDLYVRIWEWEWE